MDYEIVFIVILVFILLLIATIYIYNYFNSNQITNGGGGISDPPPDINKMADSTLLLVNNTGNELNVFLQEKLGDPAAPVVVSWDFMIKNTCTIKKYPDEDYPAESSDAIGDSGVIVTIPVNNDPNKDNYWCTLTIPYSKGVAMRLSPVVIVKVNGVRTMLSKYFQGAPSLIEFGKDMVANMSIEDGTTYNMSQKLTIPDPNIKQDDPAYKTSYIVTDINYRGNPCTYNGTDVNGQPIHRGDSYPFQNYFLPGTSASNLFGCLVGNSNGTFPDGITENTNPYYHLTGNLSNPRKTWCDYVQIGQCTRDGNNSSLNCKAFAPTEPAGSPATFNGDTCPGCFENGKQTKFTTYCYDYNDLSSSPALHYPYKMQVLFKNLADTHLEELTIPDCIETPYEDKCGVSSYRLSKKSGSPDCPEFLNRGNLNIINVCYQNGGPPPDIKTCQFYNLSPPCPGDYYACYQQDNSVACNKDADEFKNPGYYCKPLCYNGDGPTGPTGPTGGTCNPPKYQNACNSQCAVGAHVCINGADSAKWGCYDKPITCGNNPNAKCEYTCQQGPRS